MYEQNGRRPIGVDQALWTPIGWYLRDLDAVKTSTPGFQFSTLVVPEPTTTPGGDRYIFEANAGGPPDTVSALWRWFVWRDLGRALVPRSAILFPVSAG